MRSRILTLALGTVLLGGADILTANALPFDTDVPPPCEPGWGAVSYGQEGDTCPSDLVAACQEKLDAHGKSETCHVESATCDSASFSTGVPPVITGYQAFVNCYFASGSGS